MRARTFAGLGLAGAAGLAFYGGQVPTAQIFGPTICRGAPGRKVIALTYDDGPNPVYTPTLMALLERFDAKATFFLIGGWAEREPELVRELRAAGHAIGNHTFTHPTMPLLDADQVREELRRCRGAVEAAGEEFSKVGGEMLMRPPYGRRRPGTLRTLHEEGYVPVTWSITAYDWRRTATTNKLSRRCARAKDGDVILLHDGSNEEPAADRSRSVAATERTLERFTAEGYRFVTIPELAEGAPA